MPCMVNFHQEICLWDCNPRKRFPVYGCFTCAQVLLLNITCISGQGMKMGIRDEPDLFRALYILQMTITQACCGVHSRAGASQASTCLHLEALPNSGNHRVFPSPKALGYFTKHRVQFPLQESCRQEPVPSPSLFLSYGGTEFHRNNTSSHCDSGEHREQMLETLLKS